MIISHKYRFIFLRTLKTAGTSTEIALSEHCGPDDIITSIREKDEKIRAELGYRGPQNHLFPVGERGLGDIVRVIRMKGAKEKYWHHMSAEKIKQKIGENIWNNYYKFCTERNPWERFISHYYNYYTKSPRPPISEVIGERMSTLKRTGFELYSINGEIAVDKVCLFENLSSDLEDVRVHLGIPEPLTLPRAKTEFRKDKRNFREILSEEQIEEIKAVFSHEINMYGYSD